MDSGHDALVFFCLYVCLFSCLLFYIPNLPVCFVCRVSVSSLPVCLCLSHYIYRSCSYSYSNFFLLLSLFCSLFFTLPLDHSQYRIFRSCSCSLFFRPSSALLNLSLLLMLLLSLSLILLIFFTLPQPHSLYSIYRFCPFVLVLALFFSLSLYYSLFFTLFLPDSLYSIYIVLAPVLPFSLLFFFTPPLPHSLHLSLLLLVWLSLSFSFFHYVFPYLFNLHLPHSLYNIYRSCSRSVFSSSFTLLFLIFSTLPRRKNDTFNHKTSRSFTIFHVINQLDLKSLRPDIFSQIHAATTTAGHGFSKVTRPRPLLRGDVIPFS